MAVLPRWLLSHNGNYGQLNKSDAIANFEGDGKSSQRELDKAPIVLRLSNVKHTRSEFLLSSNPVTQLADNLASSSDTQYPALIAVFRCMVVST